jgi:hypothetical protein
MKGSVISSALGAAIIGGQRAYQDTVKLKRDQQTTDIENQLRLQEAILNDQKLQDIPRDRASKRLEQILALQGADAYNNPEFISLAQQAGTPISTINIDDARKNELTQHGFDQPALTREQLAQHFGVAPDTGAKIPLAIRAGQSKLHREDVTDEIKLRQLDNFSNGSNGGYEIDPRTGMPSNSAGNRAKEVFDPMQRITKMYGPASDMPSNVADRDAAAAAAKSIVPSAMIQRVTGGMQETVDNLTTAQRELEKMFPGIEAPDDPNRQIWQQPYNNPITDLARAKGLRVAYNFMDTPYNKAIQAASLGNVQGWGNLVPGRINPGIQAKAQEHQSAFGNETPRATYTRNRDLITMLMKNRQDLLTPQMAPGAQVPQPAAAPQTAPQVTPDMVAGREAPAGAPPPTAPPPAQQPAKITSVKFSDIVSRVKPGEDPIKLAEALKARGINVIMDRAPQQQQAPRPPALGGFSKATGISAAPDPGVLEQIRRLYQSFH